MYFGFKKQKRFMKLSICNFMAKFRGIRLTFKIFALDYEIDIKKNLQEF
jgi:hypothetical protein